MLEGVDYWEELRESPSQMEICVAIFANVLELDDQGQPVNEKHAERRAAVWLYRYCTGKLPRGAGYRALGVSTLLTAGLRGGLSGEGKVM